MRLKPFIALVSLQLFASTLPLFGGTLPRPDHVVVVILENHSYNSIIGNAAAPNLNALAAEGALFVPDDSDTTAARSGSHALRHPSQPNYLELFSGNNQGVVQDGYPGSSGEPLASPPPFNAPNLGAVLIAKGLTYATYSESLPAVGSNIVAFTTDPAVSQYQRKHNPAVNWQANDAPASNHLAPVLNQPFFALAGQPNTGFPADYATLPTVSVVVPNEQNDMHDGSVAQGDAWVKKNILDGYYAWAKTHNSLLVLTFDEDGDDTASNLITTIFAGPMIKPGKYPELNLNSATPDVGRTGGIVTPTGTALNHYNVLATIADFYGLPRIGGSIGRPAITDIYQASATTGPLVVPNNLTSNPGDTGNLFPLFSSKPIRYQQVFDRSQFSRFTGTPQMLNSIAFRAHAPGKPFTGNVSQLQVNLSTTAKAPDALSPTFADNVGADNRQVFDGPLQVAINNSSSEGTVNTFDILINFSTPFPYDPAKGNLLLDVRNLQGGTEEPPLEQLIDALTAAGDSVSRVFNYGDVTAAAAGTTGGMTSNDSLGLIVQFGTTAAPAPSPSPTPVPNGQFGNISTRLVTGAGDNVAIGGFIIGGQAKKKVVVRGLGPSLSFGGQPVPGTAQDPVIELHAGNGSTVAANDNWKETQRAELEPSGLAPKDDRESAIIASLDPGAYTVIVSAKGQTSGIALVEAYDVDPSAAPKLLNVSTRGSVQTGDNVVIGGLIISGSDGARVIFRGLGPSLSTSGVPVPDRLADPTLDLRDANGAPLAFDDNWKDSQGTAIQQSGLAPSDDKESAIIGSYAPGAYTAILRGKNETTGNGLIEAYQLN